MLYIVVAPALYTDSRRVVTEGVETETILDYWIRISLCSACDTVRDICYPTQYSFFFLFHSFSFFPLSSLFLYLFNSISLFPFISFPSASHSLLLHIVLSRSSSLCKFFHVPQTVSFLGPNVRSPRSKYKLHLFLLSAERKYNMRTHTEHRAQ